MSGGWRSVNVGSVLGKHGPGWQQKGEKWQFEVRDGLSQFTGRLRKKAAGAGAVEPEWLLSPGRPHDQGKGGSAWVRLCLGQRMDRFGDVAEETPTSSGPRGTLQTVTADF